MIQGKKESFCNSLLTPWQEQERVESLNNYSILDSQPDSNFDEIAYLAARAFKCPVAMINFLDKDRIWAKSIVGEFSFKYEKPFSFCQYAVQTDDIFIIQNTLQDPRLAQNPYVNEDPHILFYAAVPILSFDGYCIGTLAIFDTKEKTFKEEQYLYLKYLGTRIMKLLELRRKNILLAREMRAVQNLFYKSSHVSKSMLKRQVHSGLHATSIAQSQSELTSYLPIEKIKNKINKYLHITESDTVVFNRLLECLRKCCQKKITQLGIQLEFIVHLQENEVVKTNPTILLQLLIALMEYAIAQISFRKFKWILFEVKDNESELEISFSFTNSNFQLFSTESPSSSLETSAGSQQEDIRQVGEYLNSLNGHCLLDNNSVHSRLTLFIPKNSRGLLN